MFCVTRFETKNGTEQVSRTLVWLSGLWSAASASPATRPPDGHPHRRGPIGRTACSGHWRAHSSILHRAWLDARAHSRFFPFFEKSAGGPGRSRVPSGRVLDHRGTATQGNDEVRGKSGVGSIRSGRDHSRVQVGLISPGSFRLGVSVSLWWIIRAGPAAASEPGGRITARPRSPARPIPTAVRWVRDRAVAGTGGTTGPIGRRKPGRA